MLALAVKERLLQAAPAPAVAQAILQRDSDASQASHVRIGERGWLVPS